MKTALLFGATGLTGMYLLDELVKNNTYAKIKVFGRKNRSYDSDKIELHTIDLNKLEDFSELIIGDDLFCCLGTTVKNAGSKEATRMVDFNYPVKIAEIASKNKVKNFVVISTLGANPKSSSFYFKNKGIMEEAIKYLDFVSLHALRPSMLLGKRNEFRFGEIVGKAFIHLFGWLMIGKLRRFKAVHSKDVARAMIFLANNNYGDFVIHSEKIKELAIS